MEHRISLEVDTLEAGTGPTVLLVHSSASSARQWRQLISDLEDRFHFIAVNLFGYGNTSSWSDRLVQRLEDQAMLVEAMVPTDNRGITLIGHSFGGTVAMKAAARLGSSVDKLILVEPNPFYLLRQHGRLEAFNDSVEICKCVRDNGKANAWLVAAERFADYWGGDGTWMALTDERRSAFAESLKPNFHEWDSVMNETTTLQEWARLLPKNTIVISAKRTVRPIREIAQLMQEHCTAWRYEQLARGGHMAPLTHPGVFNSLIESILEEDVDQT